MKSNRLQKINVFLLVLFATAATLGSALAKDESGETGAPDSHRAGWENKHQQYAKSNESQCMACHKPKDCISCHQRRDDVLEKQHKRNWKFYHSVEARANPKSCTTCHTINYCTDCHQNPR